MRDIPLLELDFFAVHFERAAVVYHPCISALHAKSTVFYPQVIGGSAWP